MAGLFRAGQGPIASEPREPKARVHHAAVVVDNNMLVWGGFGVDETSTVETFDVSSATWLEPRQLHGDTLPNGLYNMAVTSDKKKAYVIGGSFKVPSPALHSAFRHRSDVIGVQGAGPRLLVST